MKRVLIVLLLLVMALVVVPPVWFRVFPAEAPDLPAAGRSIAVGGGLSVNALDRGAGPPLVLVHGLPGSAYDWAPLIDALAERGRRVIAYDRVGYGYSDGRRDQDFTMDANVRDLVGLLESEDLRGATLVGWSYGGPVVMGAAQRVPERVAGLVLVGSGGPSDDSAEPPTPPAWFGPLMTWIGWVPPVGRATQRALSAQAFSDQAPPDWWLPQLAANFAQPNTRTTYLSEMMQLAASGPLEIEALGQPVLILHGSDDRLAPPAIANWLHAHVAHSELAIVEGASHMLPITHTELLANRIAAFSGPPRH
jgi:pimeloyl-ACP methyl ester carboxylesterase